MIKSTYSLALNNRYEKITVTDISLNFDLTTSKWLCYHKQYFHKHIFWRHFWLWFTCSSRGGYLLRLPKYFQILCYCFEFQTFLFVAYWCDYQL